MPGARPRGSSATLVGGSRREVRTIAGSVRGIGGQPHPARREKKIRPQEPWERIQKPW